SLAALIGASRDGRSPRRRIFVTVVTVLRKLRAATGGDVARQPPVMRATADRRRMPPPGGRCRPKAATVPQRRHSWRWRWRTRSGSTSASARGNPRVGARVRVAGHRAGRDYGECRHATQSRPPHRTSPLREGRAARFPYRGRHSTVSGCMSPRRLMPWLEVPAIADPVDRRNAPIRQVALLVLGTMPPLLWLYRITTGIPWRPGDTLSLVISLMISALALWSVVLIRRALFQRAIRQLMLIVAALTVVSHAANGLSVHVFEMPVQLLWLFIAGMMIGRGALWLMFAALVLALGLGALAEARLEQEPLDHLLGDAVIRSIMFLTIALVIDRSVAALRESLDEALVHGRALERSNARLQAEMAAREQAQARLLHAQKMEAVGRMASGLAHDFGHLLALVDGYADQAQRAAGAQARAEALEAARTAAGRARAQVRKLMHFARQDTPSIEVFDAGEVLHEVGPMLRQTLGPAVRLRIEPPAGPAIVRADREQFALVLLNLAANAADAMPYGGS